MVAEAEEHARGSCRLCGADVEGGVANHCKSAFSAAQRNRMMDHVGCGLGAPGPQCVAADDTCEEAPDSQFGKQFQRKKLRLVGNDRKLATLAGERIQCIEASGIEHRMLRNMRLVIFEQRGIEVGEPVFFHHPASDCERSLEHQPRAAPYQVASLVGGNRPTLDLRNRVIHRRCQVAHGVRQRPVEVETNRGEGKIAHEGRSADRLWNAQAFGGIAATMSQMHNRPLAAIVLAAGKGTRMKSARHKVLHPIAGRPMIKHLLAALSELSPARTIVVVGDGRDQIEAQLGGRAELVVQEPQLGTGHAVQQAEAALGDFDGDVLVLYADVPFVGASTMRAMLGRLGEEDAPAAVVLGFEPSDPLQYGRVIANDGLISKMVEHRDANEVERSGRLCNSGLLAAGARDLFALLRKVGNENAQGEYYLPDIVNIAIASGRSCAVVTSDTPEEVAGINSRAELAIAEARWQDLKREEAMAAGVSLRAPETVFFSWDTVIGRDVTIEPNVTFGPGVSVADNVTIRGFCHIEGARIGSGVEVGPFARLRPGTVLESGARVGNFVEIKNAVLGPGAKANHLTYLGDATVGEGANIGAGTITCNYDGYFKHRTAIGDRAFIGSNSALIAPVTIGDDAIVAAGSAVSRDVADGELRMVRAEQMVKSGWADRFHDAMRKKKAAEKKA